MVKSHVKCSMFDGKIPISLMVKSLAGVFSPSGILRERRIRRLLQEVHDVAAGAVGLHDFMGISQDL